MSPPSSVGGLTATVLVSSYARPDDLRRCLAGLTASRRAPEAVVVVSSPEDGATTAVAEGFTDRLPLTVVLRTRPGLAAAYEEGFAAASTDVVAVIDDDAVARPDWLERVVTTFERHPDVGALGGRDCVHGDESTTVPPRMVGRVSALGKLLGNHHLGAGDPFTIEHLKGVNMSFRADAVRGLPLGDLVVGTGAQHGNELFTSWWVTRRGYRILFDPAVKVDHYMAARPPEDQRAVGSLGRITDDVHNQVKAAVGLAGPRTAWAVGLRSALVGSREHPAVVVGLVEARRRGPGVVARQVAASLTGAARGLASGLALRRRLAAAGAGNLEGPPPASR